MRRILLLLVILIAFFLGTAFPTSSVGWLEYATISPPGFIIRAKLDTGAKTSSLDAQNIILEQIENDETIVHFELKNRRNKKKYSLSLPLVKTVNIKKRKSERSKKNSSPTFERPVVKIKLCLGTECLPVFVNLNDRQHFNYGLLIGRDTLAKFNFTVDPSKTHTLPKYTKIDRLR